MSQKEKCGICNHETPCPHSRLDKALSIQKESEWEGKILKEFREGYQKRSREEDERFLLLAIETAVAKREKEIAEEVEKLLVQERHHKNCLALKDSVHYENHKKCDCNLNEVIAMNLMCKKFLSILKH